MSFEYANPHLPHISWNAPTAIRVYGTEVLLDGFRAFGFATKTDATSKILTESVNAYATYDYQTDTEGFSQVNFTAPGDEWWVAVFAVAEARDARARCVFVPYLQVTAWNATTNTATLSTLGGTITGDFARCDVLACTSNGLMDGRVFKIVSNTTNTVTLDPGTTTDGDARSLSFAIGDYLLLAPGSSGTVYDYKYLRTLKLDYDAPTYSFRNFVFAGDRTHSYHGNLPDITTVTPSFTEVKFGYGGADARGAVPPLAIGVIGNLQAYTSVAGDSPYIYLSQDSSNHVLAWVGTDRTFTTFDGVSAPFQCGFNREKQSLWVQVSTANVVGKIAVLGWIE